MCQGRRAGRPGTTGDQERQWMGPIARPTAMPIGKALPRSAAVAIGKPAASRRATAHTTKQNSTPTASTTRSQPSPTAKATCLVADEPGLVCGRGSSSGSTVGDTLPFTTARATSGGTAASSASRPVGPKESTPPIARGAKMPVALATALTRLRRAAAVGPRRTSGATSTSSAPPSPMHSPPATATPYAGASASSTAPAAHTREPSRSTVGSGHDRSSIGPTTATTTNPTANADDSSASRPVDSSRSRASTATQAPSPASRYPIDERPMPIRTSSVRPVIRLSGH